MEEPLTKNSGRLPGNSEQIKAAWQPMEMEYLGNAAQLVHGGGGKLSITGGDPGEGRKQKGQGNT